MTINRHLGRNALKMEYKKFCELWKNERMMQRIIVSSGKQIPEGQQVLGHKPTFHMWLDAKRRGAFKQPVPEKMEKVQDTNWEE